MLQGFLIVSSCRRYDGSPLIASSARCMCVMSVGSTGKARCWHGKSSRSFHAYTCCMRVCVKRATSTHCVPGSNVSKAMEPRPLQVSYMSYLIQSICSV